MKKHIVIFSMIFLIALSTIPKPLYALSDSERTWYPGEGMKEGDFFEYEICHDSCSEKYMLKIWISSEKENYRNIKMEIVDYMPETYYKISKTDLKISDGSSDSLNLYSEVNQFSSFIKEERKFTDVSWGKFGNIGGEQLMTAGSGTYSIRAGSFDGTMKLQWKVGVGGIGEVLIADNMPYPTKASMDGYVSSGPPQERVLEFELVKYQQGVQVDDPEPIPAPTPKPSTDTIPPEILIPSNITKTVNNPEGLQVDFTVKAIDNVDEILIPTCTPPSGSMFPTGTTAVNCSVTDSYGNISEKSFLVTVEQKEFTVPTWVKNVAGYWCGEEIEDSAFIQALQYLITTNVIVIPSTNSTGGDTVPIPSWIKNTACWWSQDTITDGDFIGGIQFLVESGIIQV